MELLEETQSQQKRVASEGLLWAKIYALAWTDKASAWKAYVQKLQNNTATHEDFDRLLLEHPMKMLLKEAVKNKKEEGVSKLTTARDGCFVCRSDIDPAFTTPC